jgi:hypothetical protein
VNIGRHHFGDDPPAIPASGIFWTLIESHLGVRPPDVDTDRCLLPQYR